MTDIPPHIGNDVGKLPILSVKKREGGRVSIIDEHGREIASVRPRKDYDAEAVARRIAASFNLCNHSVASLNSKEPK